MCVELVRLRGLLLLLLLLLWWLGLWLRVRLVMRLVVRLLRRRRRRRRPAAVLYRLHGERIREFVGVEMRFDIL